MRLADEHVLAVLVPVAGLFPEAAVEHLGRLPPRRSPPHRVGGACRPPACGTGSSPLGCQNTMPRASSWKWNRVHGPPEPAVVAPLRLLDAVQIGFQVVFAGPGGAVDALQLCLVVVAPPVGAGQFGQLERLADKTRRRLVRPAAEVQPLALVVDGDRLGLGQVADQFGLVALASLLEVGDGGFARPRLAAERRIAGHDLAHLRLDPGQVLQAEGLVASEVVIEAILDRRPDGHLRAGKQRLNRLGQHVSRVVADGEQRVRMVAGEDFDAAAVLQRPVQVQHLAVEPDQRRLLGQRLGQASSHGAAGDAFGELPHRTVRELQLDHASHFKAAGRAGGGS